MWLRFLYVVRRFESAWKENGRISSNKNIYHVNMKTTISGCLEVKFKGGCILRLEPVDKLLLVKILAAYERIKNWLSRK